MINAMIMTAPIGISILNSIVQTECTNNSFGYRKLRRGSDGGYCYIQPLLEVVVNKEKKPIDKVLYQKKVYVTEEIIRGLSTDEILDRQCKDGTTSILGWLAVIRDGDYTFLYLYDHLKVLLRLTLIARNLTVKRYLFTTQKGVLVILKVLRRQEAEYETF